MSHKSIEPVLNESALGETPLTVTAISEVGAMSNRAVITVTETAQVITIGTNKVSMEIMNTGTEPIYLGGSGVLSTTGIVLNPFQSKLFAKVKSSFSFYAICAAGKTANMRLAEYA